MQHIENGFLTYLLDSFLLTLIPQRVSLPDSLLFQGEIATHSAHFNSRRNLHDTRNIRRKPTTHAGIENSRLLLKMFQNSPQDLIAACLIFFFLHSNGFETKSRTIPTHATATMPKSGIANRSTTTSCNYRRRDGTRTIAFV